MVKTILVPTSGSETDAVVFETALAAARPCQAHLEFFHVRVSAGEALRYTPHASFARGKALRGTLRELREDSEKRWEAAPAGALSGLTLPATLRRRARTPQARAV
jgi:hypothetical protein